MGGREWGGVREGKRESGRERERGGESKEQGEVLVGKRPLHLL